MIHWRSVVLYSNGCILSHMADDQTAVTVQIDNQGRMTLPEPARHALGIDGSSAVLELTVTHKTTLGGDADE